MNTDRLLKLADHLERVVATTPGLWGMYSWAERTECGTVCCAMGHACLIPEFAAAGLSLQFDVDEDGHSYGYPVLSDGRGLHTNIRAAAAFFDIEVEDAQWLFIPDSYDHPGITPGQVAGRIRSLVRGGSPCTSG